MSRLGDLRPAGQRVRFRSWRNPQGPREERRSLLVVICSVGAGFAGGFALAGYVQSAAISSMRWPVFIVGLVVMCAGIAIRHWAVFLLDELFTVDVRVHQGQVVVNSGPYRWVRHPAYTGLIITFAGTGLALRDWAALAILVVVPTGGTIVRIRVEERALLDALGEPYRRVAATRSRRIPGVW